MVFGNEMALVPSWREGIPREIREKYEEKYKIEQKSSLKIADWWRQLLRYDKKLLEIVNKVKEGKDVKKDLEELKKIANSFELPSIKDLAIELQIHKDEDLYQSLEKVYKKEKSLYDKLRKGVENFEKTIETYKGEKLKEYLDELKEKLKGGIEQVEEKVSWYKAEAAYYDLLLHPNGWGL